MMYFSEFKKLSYFVSEYLQLCNIECTMFISLTAMCVGILKLSKTLIILE